jgi:outer membrane protein OmpA-like peptidoglycan-associated protein/tetratricopeptide (TPR) repeat protein
MGSNDPGSKKNQNTKSMKQIYLLKRIFALVLLAGSFTGMSAQESREFLRAFREADEYYYYDQNYLKAASLYEPLIQTHPDNHNLAAKLGICYLNMDGRKVDALRFLKMASDEVANSDKEYKQTGEKAPLDTYLYLAIAYQRNDSIEKALTFFNNLKKRYFGAESSQEQYIDLQIRNCRYAMEMKKRPLRLISELFAPWLIDYPGACNPVLAKNDSVFVFTVLNQGKTQVYCSYKTFKSKTWKRPVNITKQLGGYDRFYTNSITGNGRMLILFMDDGGDGNLYYSLRNDTIWSKIKSVGKYVNSIYWEAHGFITTDGKTMYFSSNRPGGEGELDIWTSQRAADGSWERPVNLGNTINTPYDENTPYFDTENNALLFSSVGLISMGGYDVFRSINRGGQWTQPVGMPYAFNNVQENTNFILNNNAPGFVASRFDEKTNARNIYAIVAVDPADEITRASGNIKLEDGMEVNPDAAFITVRNIQTGTTFQDVQIGQDGSFNFDIKPGEYQILVSHDGYKTDTINLSLPLYFAGNYLPVNPSLTPDKVSAGNFLSIKNILFDFDKYNLADEARPSLELVKNIMVNYPELSIEVAGYTDSFGSTEYNQRLADKRAQAVISYFTSGGINKSRFVKKAFGESNFVAVNSNPDGSDNPEGRKYNRRVTFGIINPKTGVVLRQEAFTPQYLRPSYAIKYSIVLLSTKEVLNPGYFKGLIQDEMLMIRTIKTDTANLYVLGIFFSRQDAQKYLAYVRESGLKSAYIVNQYDLENKAPSAAGPVPTDITNTRKVFTIQLKATKSRLSISSVFPGYDGVKEILADDGFYKYVYGEFATITQARENLISVKKDFNDAFIREINVLINK